MKMMLMIPSTKDENKAREIMNEKKNAHGDI